jgi:flagellar basal body rod protein FlgG
VRQGELEQSAVDPVKTMVDMITSLRTYQSGENAIQSINGTMQESAQNVGAIP